MTTIKTGFKNVRESLDELEEKVTSRIGAAVSFGIIKKLKILPELKVCEPEDFGSDAARKVQWKTRESSLNYIKEQFDEIKRIHDENEMYIENNRDIREKLFEFLSEHGLKKERYTWSKSDKQRDGKMVLTNWAISLSAAIPVSDFFSDVEVKYRRAVDMIEQQFDVLEHKVKVDSSKEKLMLDEQMKSIKAVQFCQNKGYSFEDGLTLASAIKTANSLQFKALKEAFGDTVQQNVCPNCNTWDGVSKHCSCGQTKMTWKQEGDFENMTIVPLAH